MVQRDTPLLASPGCAACAGRNVVIAAQAEAIAELRAKVERLERLVSRNSGNSSFPPSLDAQPGRARPAAGRVSSPGAPGSHLAWPASPDERADCFPQGGCRCGAALAGGTDLGVVASHQRVEIPLVSARMIQHDRHAVRCSLGQATCDPAPAGAGAAGVLR